MKVVELALEHEAWDWGPEELQANHPYLTLGQGYSALAYYYDHREDIDRDIERRMGLVRELKLTASPSPLKARLAAQKTV
jgi:hypothetical protein